MTDQEKSKPNIPLIGALAVKNLLITKAELQTALSTCLKEPDPEAALKEYLVSNELVSSQNMERLSRAVKALEMRKKEFKFGSIAIRKGFINQSVLKLALEEQENDIRNKKKVRMVGDMLVEAGMITEKQRDYILKLQKRVRQEIQNLPPQKTESKGPDGKGSAKPKADSSGSPEDPGASGASDKTDEADGGSDSEETDGNALLEPEVITGGIKLEVSRDLMAAFLSKTDYFDDNITVEDLKEALIDKGIVLGIVEDNMIEGFIRSSGFKTKSFRVAKGVVPVQGKDAKVEFFFNTDYLSAGGLTDDGTIDFKERGEIPYIEEGTVLAEKIPMVESRNGHNIYGDTIETVPGNDIVLKFGNGAKLSEDGYKILASVSGFPKYSLSGHIFVHQEYVTEGDVDYETGHINYNGNVNIKGRVKAGFKVEGNDVAAIEIDGGIVDADGDVRIAGGINEGQIYSRGNVYAKFVHKSEIRCMGNVIVDKEIVDSSIICSGSCVVETGKTITSKITAKMGVKIRNIGTEMAEPNIIKVGYDSFVEKELEENRAKVEAVTRTINTHEAAKNKHKEENMALQKEITELAHVQDRSQLELKEIQSKLSSMDKDGGTDENVGELKARIEELKINAQKAEENLDACFDKTEKIEELMESEDRKIADLDRKRQVLIEEKNNLIKWAKDNPGKSMVIVDGAVMAGTVITGLHSEKRVTELIRHAKIMEVLCKSDDGRNLNIYEMQVVNI